MDKEDQLAELAGDREDRYLQAISKARNAAEQAGDQNKVVNLDRIYDETSEKIDLIDKERRQKVLDSQLEALEKEITTYGEAIEKFKELVKNE